MDEMQFAPYVVTCRVESCENGNIAIPIEAPAENPFFICGVCTQQITDVTPG